MKVSVLIPAYNCEATIRATLESVLRQTIAPDEILVLDDGSTDGTADVLDSFKLSIKVFSQPNRGPATARNLLISRAQGDLIAFLDSDDLWHPQYLEVVAKLYKEYPSATAFFTGLVNFEGFKNYEWDLRSAGPHRTVEVIQPLDFFKRYNRATGFFVADCCIPRNVLNSLGSEPYKEMGAEDSYCFSLLALMGPVVHVSTPLVARRIYERSLSANHLWTFGVWVHVFELLEARYKTSAGPDLWRAFRAAFASKRRCYAKLLMGAGRASEARVQLRQSFGISSDPVSLAKSLGMLSLSYMPKQLQPEWPSSYRQWDGGPKRS